MKLPFRVYCGFIVVALAALIPTAQAAPGDLDASFGGTGKITTGFGGGYDQGHAIAVQSDGKIILGGWSTSSYPADGARFTLVRLDTNNVRDLTFGSEGVVTTDVNVPGVPYSDTQVRAVRVQPDGKIIAAGFAFANTNHPSFTLVRYHPDGTVDTTFGTNGNGIVHTDLGEGSKIRAMVLEPGGRIVVAGHTTYPANATEGAVALARYETNGVLDATFGSGGVRITTGVTGYTGAHRLLRQADGKLLAVGIGIGSGLPSPSFALYRYTTNGILDPEFGGGTGIVHTRISVTTSGYFNSANAVAIQSGNNTPQNPDRIVVAGSYRVQGTSRTLLALARYYMDGTLDAGFGNGGIVTNAISTGSITLTHSIAEGLVVEGFLAQPRRITVGGYGSYNSTNYFVMARYTSSGALDSNFGPNGNGMVAIPLGPTGIDGGAFDMGYQGGRFVLSGYVERNSQNYDFAAMRFNSNGTLDGGFGFGGLVTVDVADRGSSARGVAIQQDGRILAVGEAEDGERTVVALARYNADGTLDQTFGDLGKVKSTIGNGNAAANAVVLQPDNRIVIAGTANDDFLVARYLPDGSLDAEFATNGIATLHFGDSDRAAAISLDPTGKIVVAGTTSIGGNDDFAVARFTTNGFPDPTFDNDGRLTTAIATGNDLANALRIQSDGKIVVGGYAEVNGNIDMALVRYHTNGGIDTSFGSFGRIATDIGSGTTDAVFGLAIDPGNRIIAAGYSAAGANVDFAMVRYTTNGLLDSSFDGDGKVTTPIGLAGEYALAVELMASGRIIAVGLSQIGAHTEFAAIRYNHDGALDPGFGVGGRTFVEFDDDTENQAAAVAVDSSGRVVLAGQAGNLFGLARLLGDPELRILSIQRLPNGSVELSGTGLPSATHSLQAAPRLNSVFTTLAPVTSDSSGAWQYRDGSAPGASNRLYRLSLP